MTLRGIGATAGIRIQTRWRQLEQLVHDGPDGPGNRRLDGVPQTPPDDASVAPSSPAGGRSGGRSEFASPYSSAQSESAAESKARKLARANSTLQMSADALRSAQDVDAFLGRTMEAMAVHIGARSGTVWLLNEEEFASYLQWVLEDGKLLRAADSSHPNAHQPNYLAGKPSLMTLEAQQPPRPAIYTLDADIGLTAEHLAHFKKMGTKALLTVPMVLGTRSVGLFTFRLTSYDQPNDEDLELLQALANQATIAVRLATLSKAEAESAVAREREAAAQQRAADLIEANAALKRSLDHLAAGSDFQRFLSGVLEEIQRRLGALHLSLWACEERLDGSRTVGFTWKSDEQVPVVALVTKRLATYEARADQPVLWPSTSESHFKESERLQLEAAGLLNVLYIPLRLRDKTLGGIAAFLSGNVRMSDEDIELVQAFAHQATLALRLRQLSLENEASAVFAERARIAREIHDGIAQAFIGIRMQLNSLPQRDDPGLQRALSLAHEGLAEARRAVEALRPFQLAYKSFIEAVEQSTRDTLPSQIKLKVTLSGEWPALPPEYESNLFRLIQEAVNNVVKHSRAKDVQIELSSTARELSLLIQDNGCGFDLAALPQDHGFGLHTMRQRAASIGATFQIQSSPSGGTRVFVSLNPEAIAASRPTV